MAPPISEFSRQLTDLEVEIKKLEIEYQNFFTGRTQKMPWEMRSRLENQIKQYDRLPIQNTAERFRFQGLQLKFSAFCERWERDIKLRELGRPGPPRGRGAAAPPPVVTRPSGGETPGEAARQAAPERPSLVSLRNPDVEGEKVRELYDQLSAARRRSGEAEVPFERFQDVVRAQVAKLGNNGADVTFKVGEKDGRVTFTAKVSKDTDEE